MSALPVLWNLLRAELIQRAFKTPEFLKDELPDNASSVSRFIQSAGRRACRNYVRAGFGPGTVYGPTYDWACEPYLKTLNEGKQTDGKFDPTSSKDGGQCSGKKYSSYIKFRVSIDFGKPTFHWGPIIESYVPCNTPGYLDYYGPCYLNVANNPNGASSFEWKSTLNNSYGANGGSGSDIEIAQLLDAWVQICPGEGTDNCGTPDPYTPPTYPPNLPVIPPPTVSPPGTNNKDWDITVNPDGTLKFCIANVCTDLGGPSGPPNNPSEDPGEEDGEPTNSDPETGEAKGCVGDDKILTGIQITFTQTPPVSTTLSGQFFKAPIWAGFGPKEELIDFVQDGAWVRNEQLIIPDSEFCKCYYVKFKKGFRGKVQAFSRPKEDKKDKKK